MAGTGLDLYRAADHVVADRVVHEVGDEALDKYAIPERRSSRQVGFDDDLSLIHIFDLLGESAGLALMLAAAVGLSRSGPTPAGARKGRAVTVARRAPLQVSTH